MNKRIIMYFGIAIATIGVGVMIFASIEQATQSMELTTSGIKSTGAYIGAVLLILVGAVFIIYGTSTIKADFAHVAIESEAEAKPPDPKPIPPPTEVKLEGPVTTITGAPVQKKEGG